MNLGEYLHNLVKEHGISRLYQENQEKMTAIGVSSAAFEQRMKRLRSRNDYKVTDDLKFLQIILDALPLDFDKLISSYENTRNITKPVIPEKNVEKIDPADAIDEIKKDLKYIRNQLDKKIKRKKGKSITYYYYFAFINDVNQCLNNGTHNPAFYNYLKNSPVEDLNQIKSTYLDYFPKDTVISDYYYNICKHNLVVTGDSFHFFLVYLLTHYTQYMIENIIILEDKENVTKLLSSIKHTAGQVINYIFKTEAPIHDAAIDKTRDVVSKLLSILGEIYNINNLQFNRELLIKYFFTYDNYYRKKLWDISRYEFGCPSDISEKLKKLENEIANLKDIYSMENQYGVA